MRKSKLKSKKRSAPRRPAKAESSPRQPNRRAATARARPKTGIGAKGWKDTTFVISHLRDEDFKVDGLRPYGAYRDLGVAKATNGMVQAHVIRNVRPFKAEDVSKRHYHNVDFQLVYCIKGSMTSEIDGKPQKITAGTCWIQPPGIRHTVLGYSDDLELLEIIMPAEFDTVEV